ncbi:MAG TPA: hypothetical protein VK562_09345, partial [Candidatus Acidoferrum sp.]|nr:hypothetical protein [Candidatus Acidoferrum sp.]
FSSRHRARIFRSRQRFLFKLTNRKCIRISGYELWKIENDGLIVKSKGHFDSVEYERQLKHGVDD